jgi:hypothetical protein
MLWTAPLSGIKLRVGKSTPARSLRRAQTGFSQSKATPVMRGPVPQESVDKMRQNSLPLVGFAKKFVARAMKGRPIDRGGSVVEQRNCDRVAGVMDSKICPGQHTKEL